MINLPLAERSRNWVIHPASHPSHLSVSQSVRSLFLFHSRSNRTRCVLLQGLSLAQWGSVSFLSLVSIKMENVVEGEDSLYVTWLNTLAFWKGNRSWVTEVSKPRQYGQQKQLNNYAIGPLEVPLLYHSNPLSLSQQSKNWEENEKGKNCQRSALVVQNSLSFSTVLQYSGLISQFPTHPPFPIVK